MLLSVEQFWLSGWSPLITLGLSDALGVSDGFSLSTSLTAQASLALDDVFVSTFGKQLTDDALVRSTVSREWGISVTREETLSLQDILGKNYSTDLSDSVGSSEGFGFGQSVRQFAEELVSFDEVTSAGAYYRDIPQTVGISSSRMFGLSRQTEDSLAVQDALEAVLYQQLFGFLSSTMGLSSDTAFMSTTRLSDALSLAAESRAEVARELSDTMGALSDSLRRDVGVGIYDTSSLVDSVDVSLDLSEDLFVYLSDTLSLLDDLAKSTELVTESTMLLSDSPLSSWFILLSYRESMYRASLVGVIPHGIEEPRVPQGPPVGVFPVSVETPVDYTVLLTTNVPEAKVRAL